MKILPSLAGLLGLAAAAEGPLSLQGYVDAVQGAQFSDDLDSLHALNWVQNRLNVRFAPAGPFSAALEGRNRLYYGDAVRDYAGLGSQLSQDPGRLDLSWNVVDQTGAIWNLSVDRAWAQWKATAWQLTLGRQRVNWGVATTWNPDDWFNAYDFLDFDYPERPGSDAVRLQIFPGPLTLDAAAKIDAQDKAVAALRLGFNRWTYDFQALGGWVRGDAAEGLGWAGNLGEASFKGEVAAFEPVSDSGSAAVVVTTEVDEALPGGIWLSGSLLFNSQGAGDLAGVLSGAATGLSAKNPFPSQWAVFGQISKTVTPLFTPTLGLLYAPDAGAVVILPTLAYSLAENWDLTLLSQTLVLAGQHPGYAGAGLHGAANGIYLRLNWSF